MKEKLHLFAQYLLPQHTLSRLARLICECRFNWFKNWLISSFIKHFKVNMSESLQEDIKQFAHFNDFFTRQLKPDLRPIDLTPDSLISPVDGVISQIGCIEEQTLLQAKGKYFTLPSLLACPNRAKQFTNGYFSTLYLAPKDYHRIHMPFSGQLKEMIHIPGKLFSVNPYTTSQVDDLFARNERVVCLFETTLGPMAVVLVGAFFVGSIRTVWAGRITPPTGRKIQTWSYGYPKTSDIYLEKGEQIGAFELGSTVILLFPEHSLHWLDNLQADSSLKIGEKIGRSISRTNPKLNSRVI